ncbi:MAG: hypothetical protein WC876_01840 [Candidatus Thermoplasmatota archaeon]|jgi:hypothetical protein
MADAPKTRYFTSTKAVFMNGQHYAPGRVIPVQPEKCNGREHKKVDGKSVITQLDKPAKHFTECNAKGGPLGTNTPPAPPEPKAPEVPSAATMSEIGKHAGKPAEIQKPGKH